MPSRAKPAGQDPSESVREAVATLEERVDAIATAIMGTEEFAKTANFAANLQLRMQKGMAGHMSRQLALFNMPSRDDMTALAERVMTMDERLVRIEELLVQILSAQNGSAAHVAAAAGPRPARTRRPRPKEASARNDAGASANGGSAERKKAPAKQTAKRKTAKKRAAKATAKKTAKKAEARSSSRPAAGA